jgi:exonuclease III
MQNSLPVALIIITWCTVVDMSQLPNLTVSSINCNSLNVSNLSSLHHKLKLYSITKLKTDIILLSDTRVNDKNKVTMSHLSKTFLTNPNAQYDYFSNSTHSSRGVGILI